MALYSAVKTIVDDNIYDNITEDITGAIHNNVCHEIIDAAGARQMHFAPAVTFDPGTPENPVSYLAYPGTYVNFLSALATPIEITAPLGVMKWDGGPYWTVTQLTIPSAYNQFRAKTTSAYNSGTPYTTIAISQAATLGWTAKAGHWVQLVNRRTGRTDFVQLKADMGPTDSSISIVTRTLVYSMAVGSLVEVFPSIGMKWWTDTPIPGAVLPPPGEPANFVDLPDEWRPPPVECTDPLVYLEYMVVTKNGYECSYSDDPTEEFEYTLDPDERKRIRFANELDPADVIRCKLWQPAVLEIAS